jgi:hypothetical protein
VLAIPPTGREGLRGSEAVFNRLELPLGLITRITPKTSNGSISIYTKHLLNALFYFNCNIESMNKIVEILRYICFPPKIFNVFAFESKVAYEGL